MNMGMQRGGTVWRIPVVLGTVLSALIWGASCGARTASSPRPPAARGEVTLEVPEGNQTAVLAGGCFWCTEAVFEELVGVTDVVSGYAGGRPETAEYGAVSAGGTNHAEVIRITYDPERIAYSKLLEVFFAVAHDPTQLNRQGPDHGRQYRSAVFYASPEEEQVARSTIQQLDADAVFDKPIVTTLEPLEAFYPAEQYHQDYVRLHPSHGYVVRNALPKLAKLHKRFPELIEADG